VGEYCASENFKQRLRWISGDTMQKLAAILLTALFPALAVLAQTDAPILLREVHGQTIISNELPKADLTVGKDFQYVGGQRVNLYGNAEAEQHIFVKAGARGVVKRFYWLQFEHFLPTNKHTYDYRPDRTTDIGGLRFIYDVKSWPDYAENQIEDPASDGAAIARLLNEHNLTFPKKVVRVRMFYLPTPDRRTELMIIYGEALPDDSTVPVREGGVELDKESPESAHMFLEHARRDLSIIKK
jgi:hypothetical protein